MTLPETIPEEDFVERYLEPMSGTPRVIQIGANEGRFEYAKVDGKDFLFDFLHTHPHWQALLIEPIPPIFDRLRENYSGHPGIINFLNCAITESVEQRALQVSGKDGKSSRLVEGGRRRRVGHRTCTMPVLPNRMSHHELDIGGLCQNRCRRVR